MKERVGLNLKNLPEGTLVLLPNPSTRILTIYSYVVYRKKKKVHLVEVPQDLLPYGRIITRDDRIIGKYEEFTDNDLEQYGRFTVKEIEDTLKEQVEKYHDLEERYLKNIEELEKLGWERYKRSEIDKIEKTIEKTKEKPITPNIEKELKNLEKAKKRKVANAKRMFYDEMQHRQSELQKVEMTKENYVNQLSALRRYKNKQKK